jgi:hypothetical protein
MRTSMWYKEEKMKKIIENSNNFDMSSLPMMVDVWSAIMNFMFFLLLSACHWRCAQNNWEDIEKKKTKQKPLIGICLLLPLYSKWHEIQEEWKNSWYFIVHNTWWHSSKCQRPNSKLHGSQKSLSSGDRANKKQPRFLLQKVQQA